MQSCNEKLSDLHTLCLKDTLHKSSPCACTWRQRDVALVTALPGAGTHHRIFPASYAQILSIWDGLYGSGTPTHILCKAPADISHTLQSFPSSQPTRSCIQQGVSQPVSPAAPLPHLIQFLSALSVVPSGLLAHLPWPCYVSRCFQTSTTELDISTTLTDTGTGHRFSVCK